ncbi:MAG: 30S ribosomal protein S21 [Patescibacteria group bacterium]|nr:30S ribosomal protein S21 [Patescibacteria group bacterium]
MAVVVKAKKDDSTSSLIRRFKKAVKSEDIVQKTRDRRYYKKPATLRAERKSTKRHLKKRLKTVKKMKNASPRSIQHLKQRIGEL